MLAITFRRRLGLIALLIGTLTSGAQPLPSTTDRANPSAQKKGPYLLPTKFSGDAQPVPIYQLAPDYPLALRTAEIQGEVILEFVVAKKGSVENAFVFSSTHPGFNEAALAAISRWVFKPGLKDGQPVNTRLRLPMRFRLNDALPSTLLTNTQSPELLPNHAADSKEPVVVFQVAPAYPLALRTVGIQGEVIVEFIVATNGLVKNAFAVRSTHPDFNEAAIAAVSRWIFKAGIKDGQPVNTRMQVPILFTLNAEIPSTLPPPTQPTPDLKAQLEQSLPFLKENAALTEAQEAVMPVYPFEALMKNQREILVGEAIFDPAKQTIGVSWESPPRDEFSAAANAMLDARLSLMKTGRETSGVIKTRLRLTFDSYSGNVRISDSAAALLKRLRTEGEDAAFATEADLDTPLQIVKKEQPVFPTRLRGNLDQGMVVVEYFVDGAGRAQLPHIVSASNLAFGYAACQAIAEWQFSPPMKDARPVVVRRRETIEFSRE